MYRSNAKLAGACCVKAAQHLSKPPAQTACSPHKDQQKRSKTYLINPLYLPRTLRPPRWRRRRRRTAILTTSRRAAGHIRAQRAPLRSRSNRGLATGGASLRVHFLLQVGRELLVLLRELADALLGDPVVPAVRSVSVCAMSLPARGRVKGSGRADGASHTNSARLKYRQEARRACKIPQAPSKKKTGHR